MQANHNPLPRAAVWAELLSQSATIKHPVYRLRAQAELLSSAHALLLPCHKPVEALGACVRATAGRPMGALAAWLRDELLRCARTPAGRELAAVARATAALTRSGPADINVVAGLLQARASDSLTRLNDAFGARAQKLATTGALALPGPASADPIRVADAFVADLSEPGSEDRFAPSLALVAGCARAAVHHRRPALELRMRDCLSDLSARARERARTYVPLAAYGLGGRRDGLRGARSLRAQGQRRAALLLLVRAALSRRAFADARAFLGAMAPSLWRQRACLLMADALAERGLATRTRAVLAEVTADRLRGYGALAVARADLRDPERRPSPMDIWDRLLALPRSLLGAAAVPEVPWTPAGERPLIMAEAIARELARVGDKSGARDRLGRWLSDLPGLAAAARCERGAQRLAQAFAADPANAYALRELYRPERSFARDLMLCADIAERARGLCARARVHTDECERAMADGMDGAAPPVHRAAEFRDARSAYRTYYDEGVSLSARVSERRKALWRASRRCLRHALRGGPPVAQTRPICRSDSAPGASVDDLALLRARLRIAVNLGAPTAARDLARLLTEEPCHGRVYPEVLAALARLAPGASARIALTRLPELAAGGQNIDALLPTLEDAGALPKGFTRECRLVLARLTAGMSELAAMEWLHGAIEAGFATGASVADLWFLRGVRARLAGYLDGAGAPSSPPPADQVLAEAGDELAGLRRLAPAALVQALLERPGYLQLMRWLTPPSLPEQTPAWTAERWRGLLSQARSAEAIDTRQVRALARRLTGRGTLERPRHWRAIARAMIAGSFPVPGGNERISLGRLGASAGCRYELRFLDKRRDLLSHLRCADVTSCCFNSTSGYYQCRCHNFRRWVVALWRDPLSFCFHIDRVRASSTEIAGDAKWVEQRVPVGFVFGGYGLITGKRRRARPAPALLINGVYLRHQNKAVRTAVLTAIERELCAPLGIGHLGVANAHAGRGALPATYVQRPAQLTRVRALVRKGDLVTEVYDDISSVVNRPVLLDNLWWREVSGPAITQDSRPTAHAPMATGISGCSELELAA